MNIIIPPIKVTQSAAPQAVEKHNKCASLTKVVIFADFDPNVSGENITPIAKKAIAVKNRVIQPMTDFSDLKFVKIDCFFLRLNLS